MRAKFKQSLILFISIIVIHKTKKHDMKLQLNLCLFLAMCFLFSACHKTNADAPADHVNIMSVDINSNHFTSGNMPDATKSTTTSGTQLTITASSSVNPKEYITLVIKNYTGVKGTYQVIGISGDAYGAYNNGTQGSSDILSSNPSTSPGTIVVNSITTGTEFSSIGGSFNFTDDTYNFANGIFNVTFPK